MSSASSTDRGGPGRNTGLSPWHFYLLISMAGATWAVIVSRHTHPAALLLISAAVIAAGVVGMALHAAIAGFVGGDETMDEVSAFAASRAFLEREKALVLRSIKELEFDRAMGKVGDKDFVEISSRLRLRAMEIMEKLEESVRGARLPVPGADDTVRAAGACPSCSTLSDADARFCKNCGAKL